MIDLIVNNQDIKKIIHERMNTLGVGIDDVVADINIKQKDLSSWLINDEVGTISHEKIIELANNLGLEVRITLIKHDIQKSLYGNDKQEV